MYFPQSRHLQENTDLYDLKIITRTKYIELFYISIFLFECYKVFYPNNFL